jgi:hypothetical protein
MDRTTKILLAAIALGLWANAGLNVIRPAWALRASSYCTDVIGCLQSINGHLDNIAGRLFRVAHILEDVSSNTSRIPRQ